MFEGKIFINIKAYYQQQQSIQQSKNTYNFLHRALKGDLIYCYLAKFNVLSNQQKVSKPQTNTPSSNYLQVLQMALLYLQSMVAPSFKIVLVVATLLALTFSQGAKAPTVVCPSQCQSFTSNGNKFKNDADAARDLSMVIAKAKSHHDIINALPSYSGSFKNRQIINLLAFRQMKILGSKTANKYGAATVKDYFNSISSESACKPYDPSAIQGSGDIAYQDMYTDLILPQTIDSLFTQDGPHGLHLPFTHMPKFFTPEKHMLDINFPSGNSMFQYLCLEQMQEDYQGIAINPYLTNVDSQVVNIKSITNDAVMGFSNMLLNTVYGLEYTETYLNCVRQIYANC